MLMSVVVEPAAFDKRNFGSVGYREHAETFISELGSNLVLIVDSKMRLWYDLYAAIENLPDKYGQYIKLEFAEFVKNYPIDSRSRPLKVVKTSAAIDGDDIGLSNPGTLVHSFKKKVEVDTFLVGHETAKCIAPEDLKDGSITPLSDYIRSLFRHNKDSFRGSCWALDLLSEEDLKNLIVHLVRFTQRVRFFDYVIGSKNDKERSNRLPGFYEGIKYILEFYRDNHFENISPQIEIITSFDSNTQQAFREEVFEKLIDPLRGDFPSWTITLRSTKNIHGSMRRRWFQTDLGIFEFTKGFDIFAWSYNPRRTRYIRNNSVIAADNDWQRLEMSYKFSKEVSKL